MQPIDELQARQSGHVDVAQHQADLLAGTDLRQRFLRIGLGVADISGGRQYFFEENEHRRVVIEEEHFGHVFRSGGRRHWIAL